MKKIRLSYTLINLWERGEVDSAVETYFHLDRTITPQMEDGKEIHDQIDKHIQTHGKFPEWFFTYPLKSPKPEKELVVEYNDMFDLKCYIDCIDGDLMFEYKTGRTDSLEWARTDQLPLYFLISDIAGFKIKSAFLIRYNQYDKETDVTVVHNSVAKRERAANIIDSVGPEIYQFFSSEGLI